MESPDTLTLHPSLSKRMTRSRAFNFSSNVVIEFSVRVYIALNGVPARSRTFYSFISDYLYYINFACLLISASCQSPIPYLAL